MSMVHKQRKSVKPQRTCQTNIYYLTERYKTVFETLSKQVPSNYLNQL